MKALVAGAVLAFLLALLLTPLVRRLALQVGALDPFSARKVLSAPSVPRLGGLGVAAAFYLTVALLWILRSSLTRATLAADTPVLAILLGGLPILAVGAVDDLRGLQALPKLIVETLVSLALWGLGLRVLPGLGEALLGPQLAAVLSCLLTVLWLVGVMNATNLIDGLDGLASGVALFALVSTAVAALWRGDLLLALLAWVLAGSVLGFLVYNIRPASIFLGDAGSLFLGYLLAATAVWSVRKAATAVVLIFPLVALGLPLLDTSLTISRRLLSGWPITQGDRDHVHHRLRGRFGVGRAVYILYAVCAVFSALSLTMLLGGRQAARLALGGAVLFALTLAYLAGYLRGGPHGLWSALHNRRRNRQLLHELDALHDRLATARTPAELSALVVGLGTRFGHPLSLVGTEATTDAATTRYPIGAGQQVHGYLRVAAPEAALGPDEQTLLQLLCDLMAPALGRMQQAG